MRVSASEREDTSWWRTARASRKGTSSTSTPYSVVAVGIVEETWIIRRKAAAERFNY